MEISGKSAVKLVDKTKMSFSTYLTCHNGAMVESHCPSRSMFWFAIQCCVPLSKYPSKSNCLAEEVQDEQEISQDYEMTDDDEEEDYDYPDLDYTGESAIIDIDENKNVINQLSPESQGFHDYELHIRPSTSKSVE